MIIGGFLAAILILLVMSSSSGGGSFADRPCGYCEQYIHWNKRASRWIHADGNIEAPLGLPCFCGDIHSEQLHSASPKGIMGA